MNRLPILALLASFGAVAFTFYMSETITRNAHNHTELLLAMQADMRWQEAMPDIVTKRDKRETGTFPDGTTCEYVTVISNGWELRSCTLPGEPLPSKKPGTHGSRSGGEIPLVDSGQVFDRNGAFKRIDAMPSDLSKQYADILERIEYSSHEID